VIARTLAELSRDVVADLQAHGYRAKTVTIKIRFSDFETFTRGMTIPDYINAEGEIRKAAFACLKRIELTKKVRLVGVRASNLQKQDIDDGHPPEVHDRLI
jgi:DNA polymerase IV